jgi:hypothetical protein
MVHHSSALETLELAERESPFCSCGQPTTPVVHRDGAIWLECLSLAEPKGVLRRLFSPSSGHTRREILPAA